MNQYKLKKSSPLTGILAALLALAVIRFLFVVLTISSREIPVGMTVILLAAYGIASVVFLILLLRMAQPSNIQRERHRLHASLRRREKPCLQRPAEAFHGRAFLHPVYPGREKAGDI